MPAFYAPETKEGQYFRMVVFALFGIVFGGIHCAGWNFKFPTLIEQHLWRSTSLMITVIPLVVALVDFILTKREENMAMFTTVVFWALDLIMTPTFRVCHCRTCACCTAACVCCCGLDTICASFWVTLLPLSLSLYKYYMIF